MQTCLSSGKLVGQWRFSKRGEKGRKKGRKPFITPSKRAHKSPEQECAHPVFCYQTNEDKGFIFVFFFFYIHRCSFELFSPLLCTNQKIYSIRAIFLLQPCVAPRRGKRSTLCHSGSSFGRTCPWRVLYALPAPAPEYERRIFYEVLPITLFPFLSFVSLLLLNFLFEDLDLNGLFFSDNYKRKGAPICLLCNYLAGLPSELASCCEDLIYRLANLYSQHFLLPR